MWDIENRTPFQSCGYHYRDGSGLCAWVVCVKATLQYSAERGLTVARDQSRIFDAPIYTETDVGPLYHCDSDIHPPKPKVDLLVHGYAGSSSTDRDDDRAPYPIHIRFGECARTLFIHPPRVWGTNGEPRAVRDDAPFLLDWRAAYGGGDYCSDAYYNPFGMGYHSRPEDAVGRPLPRLLSTPADLDDCTASLSPVSPGAVPPMFPSRRALAGTYDDSWKRTKAPLPPDDFDPAHFQSASVEQQASRSAVLDGTLTLEGLAGGGGDVAHTVSVPVPKVHFDVSTKAGATWQSVEMGMSTVQWYAQRNIATITWHGSLDYGPAHRDVSIGDTHVALDAAHDVVFLPEHMHFLR